MLFVEALQEVDIVGELDGFDIWPFPAGCQLKNGRVWEAVKIFPVGDDQRAKFVTLIKQGYLTQHRVLRDHIEIILVYVSHVDVDSRPIFGVKVEEL